MAISVEPDWIVVAIRGLLACVFAFERFASLDGDHVCDGSYIDMCRVHPRLASTHKVNRYLALLVCQGCPVDLSREM